MTTPETTDPLVYYRSQLLQASHELMAVQHSLERAAQSAPEDRYKRDLVILSQAIRGAQGLLSQLWPEKPVD